MKDSERIKLQHADMIGRQIMALCLKQCECPDGIHLLRIRALLGDFANNLRSALNYAMRDFVDAKVVPALSKSGYDETTIGRDFPWSESKPGFDRKPLVRHIRALCEAAYTILESSQPFYQGNERLGHLMRISNQDKHVDINKVIRPIGADIAAINPDGTPHHGPGFFGPGRDRMLVTEGEQVSVRFLPCYYYPYGAFALVGGRWALFLICIDQVQTSLTRFIEGAPVIVNGLVEDLNALT